MKQTLVTGNPGGLVQVFAVVANTDLIEGRGRSHDIAYFSNDHEARRYAKGRDVMGSDARVEPRDAVLCTNGRLVVGEFIEVFASMEDEETSRARAKLHAALTPGEMRLLGIEP